MAEGHELAKKLNMEFFEVSAVVLFLLKARHIDIDHPFIYLSKLWNKIIYKILNKFIIIFCQSIRF